MSKIFRGDCRIKKTLHLNKCFYVGANYFYKCKVPLRDVLLVVSSQYPKEDSY